MLLSFVAVTSLQLLAFMFFMFVDLHKIRKPLPFSLAAASTFFAGNYHFVPQHKVVLFFLWLLIVLTVACLLFFVATFKIIPRFSVFSFLGQCSVDTVSLFVSKLFYYSEK